MSISHHEKSPIASFFDQFSPLDKALYFVYFIIIILGLASNPDQVADEIPSFESAPVNTDYINVNLDLSFVSQVLQKSNITIDECFRVYFDLPENVPLTEEHMLLIRDITIKQIVAGEVRSREFSDGMQMYLLFPDTLNQSDAIQFKRYSVNTLSENPTTYFGPHLQFSNHNA